MLAYEPPDRVVFSWDISPYWQPETDLEQTSEVEVRFIAETPERTRLELEHRNIDRHGDGWEGARDGVGAPDGLPRLRDHRLASLQAFALVARLILPAELPWAWRATSGGGANG